MNISVQIRRYKHGEEQALFAVYYSAIHLTASRDYTPEQVQAWAPRDLDAALWNLMALTWWEQTGKAKWEEAHK